MSVASKSFYETVQESYEEEWTGHPELVSAVEVGAGIIQGQLCSPSLVSSRQVSNIHVQAQQNNMADSRTSSHCIGH